MELFEIVTVLSITILSMVSINTSYNFYRYRKDMSKIVRYLREDTSDSVYEHGQLKIRVRTLESVYKKKVQSIKDLKKRMAGMEKYYPHPVIQTTLGGQVRNWAAEQLKSVKYPDINYKSDLRTEYITHIGNCLEEGESYVDSCFQLDVHRNDPNNLLHIGLPKATSGAPHIHKINTAINKHMKRHYVALESIVFMDNLDRALDEYDWVEEALRNEKV